MKNLIYVIIHAIFGCPVDELEPVKNGVKQCPKCGRLYFDFELYDE